MLAPDRFFFKLRHPIFLIQVSLSTIPEEDAVSTTLELKFRASVRQSELDVDGLGANVIIPKHVLTPSSSSLVVALVAERRAVRRLHIDEGASSPPSSLPSSSSSSSSSSSPAERKKTLENRVARKQIHVELKYAPRVQCPPNVLLLPKAGADAHGQTGNSGNRANFADFNVTCTVGEILENHEFAVNKSCSASAIL